MRVKSKRITFAGTKDKRAVTTQRVSAFKITPQKLLATVSRMRNLSVGNFRLRKEPIRLGDLYGNRFSIVLRDVVGDQENINKNLEFVKENGFVNYYGMQRFGTGKVASHEIGRAILKSDWQTAVELILSPNNRTDTKAALTYYKEKGDIPGTRKKLKRYCIEEKVLSGLQKYGANCYFNALSLLPQNMRTLYVHSYQSFVWNEVVSRRIEKYGLKPVAGDLIMESEQPILHNEDDTDDIEDENDLDLKAKQNVRVITQEEIDSNQFSITDVVLPLPGFDIKYPENDLADAYKELLAKDGLDLSVTHKVKDYSLSGSYRKVVQKPLNLEWEFVRYNDQNIPLFISDADKLKGKSEPKTIEDGNMVALKLSMTLHRSTYATMCLREIMRFPGHRVL